MKKKYHLTIGDISLVVEAGPVGEARYIVDMMIPGKMARMCIGYLTGSKRTWEIEFFGGKRPSISATSAKEACRQLACWALSQPSVSSLLGKMLR